MLAAGLGAPAHPAGATDSADTSPTAAGAAGDDAAVGAARVRAAVLGKRVEVPALRTESSTFYVNPEGSVTEESSTGPIRVKDEKGAWRDVDTTLELRDGVVQPKRAARRTSRSPPAAPALSPR
ncbi:hypothetical protein [Streptomyces sp. NPDC002611]